MEILMQEQYQDEFGGATENDRDLMTEQDLE